MKNVLYLVKQFNGAVTLKEVMDGDIDLYMSMLAVYEDEVTSARKRTSKARAADIISKMRG